jgi:hypothetical protein
MSPVFAFFGCFSGFFLPPGDQMVMGMAVTGK